MTTPVKIQQPQNEQMDMDTSRCEANDIHRVSRQLPPSGPRKSFEEALQYSITENAELYRRLAQ